MLDALGLYFYLRASYKMQYGIVFLPHSQVLRKLECKQSIIHVAHYITYTTTNVF